MMMWNVFVLCAGLSLLSPPVGAVSLHDSGAAPQGTVAKPAPQTPTPAERKEIKLPERLLETYVGVYELAPERTLTITLETGSLWAQPSFAPDKQPFLAESETRFFMTDGDIQLTFQKDAEGNVTGLLMDQGGRPQRELKKVK